MSVYLAKASKKSRFSAACLLRRIAIYSAFVPGIIASFYDFQLNSIALSTGTESSEAKQHIALINKLQQAYYIEHGQFSEDLAKLSAGIKDKYTNNYNYEILSSTGPVQTLHNQREVAQFESTIAIARPEKSGSKSYIGAVFAFKEDERDRTMAAAICEGDRDGVTLIPPTFDGGEIHCPPRTTMLLNNNNFDNLR
ncbi:MAG: type IV pilin-like G/H family protein [Oscillatoriaceae cyanobacterium Prado104]|nr:type IV pilin-like G/H family protein [Oscillatoriaceae cyanobacterium Prado104]